MTTTRTNGLRLDSMNERGHDYRTLIDQLTTRDHTRPSPGPSWLRTTSRRRRTGSRRLKRFARRAAAANRRLPVYYDFATVGWNTYGPIYLE